MPKRRSRWAFRMCSITFSFGGGSRDRENRFGFGLLASMRRVLKARFRNREQNTDVLRRDVDEVPFAKLRIMEPISSQIDVDLLARRSRVATRRFPESASSIALRIGCSTTRCTSTSNRRSRPPTARLKASEGRPNFSASIRTPFAPACASSASPGTASEPSDAKEKYRLAQQISKAPMALHRRRESGRAHCRRVCQCRRQR